MVDRVMVVDDDPALLMLEVAILEAQGFEVTGAEGGVEAIERLKAGVDYDVVVSDLDMPEKTGMDVIEACREVAPDSVVVICTSHGRVDVAVQTLRAGAFDFVQKPFSFDHFVSVVQRALEHRKLRDATNIFRAVQVVFTSTDANELPNIVLKTALEVLQGDYAAIFARSEDGQYAPANFHGTVRPGQAMMNALKNMCVDVEKRDDALRMTGDPKRGSPHALARILRHGNEIHGVLWVLRSADKRPFGPRDVDHSTVMAAQASLAISNARLVNDLRSRIEAMQKARNRLYTSARIEGVGRLAIELAQQLQNPVQYMRTSLREIDTYFEHASGNGGGLLEDEVTLDDARKRLVNAFDGLARIDQAVSDLGSVAQNRENQRFELGQAAQLAIRLARPRFEPTIEITNDAVISGAPGQIAQAIANLLSNADQALSAQPQPKIHVFIGFDGRNATLMVEDNGEGIPADILPLVMEPFFSSRARDGLGLNTTREIIEHHGGTVEIGARAGGGTRVIVQLPADPVEDEIAFAGDE